VPCFLRQLGKKDRDHLSGVKFIQTIYSRVLETRAHKAIRFGAMNSVLTWVSGK
jgi:hypothetical protein